MGCTESNAVAVAEPSFYDIKDFDDIPNQKFMVNINP